MLRSPQDRRGRRIVALAASASALAVGGVAATMIVQRHDEPAHVPTRAHATAPVVRGTVSAPTIVQGTLQFAGRRTVLASVAGVVTGLPVSGTRIDFGQALYLVNMQPALLLRGSIPMWRPFEQGMPDGPDVQQLETGLQTMGYLPGTVDESFTETTSAAISRMQEALGVSCVAPPPRRRAPPSAPEGTPPSALVPTCGELPLGTIVFGTSGVRVAQRRTTVGAAIEVGGPVLAVSSDVKAVRADVMLDDRHLAARGAAATVVLPDGTRVSGKVAGVGSATERRQVDGSAASVVIPTTIAVENQRRLRRFGHAPVTVRLAGEQRRGVLSVPVEALVALDDTHFAVEVPGARGGTRRIAVRTGLFAAGRVEISGRGIREGVEVVVPEG